ncbi:MAG: DUF1573 domain-containing protein [Verrucomicrobiia bacterium]|jgi:hypothetical protein
MTENWKRQFIGLALVAVIGIATGYGVATISGSRKSNAPTDVKSARDEFFRAQQNYMAALKAEREGSQRPEVRGQYSVNNGQRPMVGGRPSPAVGHPSSVPGQSSPASGPSSPVVGPKAGTWITFDENVADFGTVDQGTESVKVFIYRNKGNQTLRISDVTSTCGCTVAQPEPKVLPPGAMGKLRVSFKSGSFSGPVSKSITVRSNDPSAPALVLGVKANVRTLFALEEKVVKLGEIERGKPALREVTIKPLTSEMFQIQRVMPTHPELKGDVLPADKNGDRTMHLLISMDSNRNCGLFTYAVRLYIARPQAQAGAPKMLELIIPVTGTVVGAARVKPDSVFFGSVKQGERFKSQKLVLTSRNGKAVEVKSVDTGFEGLKAAVKALKPGMEYEIELTDAAPPPPGFFQQTLKILTTDSNVPIEVKLSGVVMKAM